jgi:hypothetical protein
LTDSIRRPIQSEQCGTATHLASLYVLAPNFDEVTSVCAVAGDPLRHHRERLRSINGEAGAVAVKICDAETIWIEVTPTLVAYAQVPLALIIITTLRSLAFVRTSRGSTAAAHVWCHSLRLTVAFPDCIAQNCIATRGQHQQKGLDATKRHSRYRHFYNIPAVAGRDALSISEQQLPHAPLPELGSFGLPLHPMIFA